MQLTKPTAEQLEFTLPNNDRLIVTEDVLAHFEHNRQHFGQRERGGLLFARFESRKTIICQASGPSKSDWMRRFQFRANKNKAQQVINRNFELGLHYVGEWHTHPEGYPNPSGDDRKAIKACFTKSEHSLDYFILAIVGQHPFPEGLWVGTSDSSDLTKLLVIP